jgi:hypothetical protein
MEDYHRCSKCGSKIGNMQVHRTDVCERAQQKAGLPPPYPLKEWPSEKKTTNLTDILNLLKKA